MRQIRPSTERTVRIVLISQWVALALGILAGVLAQGGSPEAYVAGAITAVYVIMTTALPISTLRRGLVLDVLVLFGAMFTMTAVAITGGNDSPYYLLSAMPPVLATVLGGLRIGLATGSLSSALLIAIALERGGDDLVPALGLAALYLVIVATVAQIRRILVDIEDRASKLETSERHLETANQLLQDLARATSASASSPITIGHAALESIASRYPVVAGLAVISADDGPVVVARHGVEPPDATRRRIPLEIGEQDVGYLLLSHQTPVDDRQWEEIGASVRPVALAFSNALLLQSIARHAVKEERTRLARELHDEIGPSLASLGLSLDVALVSGVDERDLTVHLEQLRGRVGELVDEVRSTVSDLRSAGAGSLTSYLESIRPGMDRVPLSVYLDERRPVRPSLAQDVYQIVGEAVRNAERHADADTIAVRGWVDFDRGRIVVEDNGGGFDPSNPADGHFGIIGMRERAEKNGLELAITSTEAGTKVELEWGRTGAK